MEPESLSAHMAKMLRTQSGMMHVLRQILQSANAEMLVRAPQASHLFENDSYVLLGPVDGPKDRLHTFFYKRGFSFSSISQGLILKK